MPQELNVLCCYACKMFQVHIVKKAKKWQCKICNEKQSIQRIYFRGSGQNCRITAQNLNMSKSNDTTINAELSTSIQAVNNVEYNTCADVDKSPHNIQESHLTISPLNSSILSNSQNDKSESDKEMYYEEDLEESMSTDILDEPGINSSTHDGKTSEALLSVYNNKTDIKTLPSSSNCKLQSSSFARSNNIDNKQPHTENKTISKTSSCWPSIFESNDELDDISVDL